VAAVVVALVVVAPVATEPTSARRVAEDLLKMK